MSAPEIQWVTLSEAEMLYAAIVGTERHHNARRNGRRDLIPDDDKDFSDSLSRNINGAAGELAVAKLTGLPWTGRNVLTFKEAADVGGNTQVRTSRNHGFKKLIIRPGDQDDHNFVSVTGDGPRYAVHGYILGREAKQHPEWVSDPGARGFPVWLVPRAALVPVPVVAVEEVAA